MFDEEFDAVKIFTFITGAAKVKDEIDKVMKRIDENIQSRSKKRQMNLMNEKEIVGEDPKSGKRRRYGIRQYDGA